MAEQITSRLTRKKLQAALRKLPGILSGSGSARGVTADVRQLLLSLGIEALSIVREAFVVKSRGGTDEAGIQWDKLKPSTIAYGRRHGAALTRKRKAAAKKGRSRRPLLTDAQDQHWRNVYAWAVKACDGDKAHAAAYAWRVVKASGGKTILGEYGDAPHEILKDTGKLFASLSPGSPDNVVRAGSGSVEVGTNVEYAAAQHGGTDTIPARPLWPEPAQWPAAWTGRILQMLGDGVLRLATKMAQQG